MSADAARKSACATVSVAFIVIATLLGVAHAQAPSQAAATAKAERGGVVVEFQAEPAGEDVRFRFRLSDTASGAPVRGVRPAAWLDLRRTGQAPDARGCTGKAAAFVGGGLLSVPSLDLNSWFVLTMNEDASISVVDPRFGFGGTQLLAMIPLDSPAGDWVRTEKQQRLFVSMPKAQLIGVADPVTWKITAKLKVPGKPVRLGLQPDERFVWAAYGDEGDGESGVAVFDREHLTEAARIALPRGSHELAFSADSRYAFITNQSAGTVTVIDAAALRKVADIRTGSQPSSISYSELSQLAFVAHEGEGGIAAISGPRAEIVARMAAAAGVRQIRFAPGGRFAVAVNPAKDEVLIVDASSRRVVQTGVIHGGPDQVTYSGTLAYIRRRADANVLMIPLDQVGVPDAPLPLVDFPGGQIAFGKVSAPSPADSIVRVPAGNAVLVANPADKTVYYYQEGMAAPMGEFSNYGHEPRAVLIVDRGLEEGPPGVFQTTGRVPRGGVYDVVFFLDSPRVVDCFEFRADPGAGESSGPTPVMLRPVDQAGPFPAGETARIHFQAVNAKTGEPVVKVGDMTALIYLYPGVWQTRRQVTETSPGIYEFTVTPPSAGIYYAHFESQSLGLRFNSPQALMFKAIENGSGKQRSIR